MIQIIALYGGYAALGLAIVAVTLYVAHRLLRFANGPIPVPAAPGLRPEGVHGCWEPETPDVQFKREAYVTRHELTEWQKAQKKAHAREFAEAGK